MYRLTFLLILFMCSAIDTDAQRRSTYESLLQRSDQPSAYIDDVYLPVDNSTGVFAVFFRLDYDLLPFLRKRPNVTPPSPELEYFAPVRMGIEIFEGKVPSSRRERQSSTSIFRGSFTDTLWAAEYEDTKSRLQHAQGLVQTQLSKREYHYELQLSRGESVRELPSRRRNISVPGIAENDSSRIILLNNLDVSGNQLSASLLNYGDNVLYGQDYDLLILLPDNPEFSSENLLFSVYQLRPGSDSAENSAVFESRISSGNVISTQGGTLVSEDDNLQLTMNLDEGSIRYAHVSIPNQEFENARYKLELKDEASDTVVSERIVHSQWLDMPVSLYNLDVAIDMMKFITGDEELRRLRSGSTADKERKFREYWAERDPTPDTEFNELMNEYYSRIDYSYQNFSSMQIPGYETDQGRAYILYGPPQNVVRRFPTNSPTREIWEYNGRTLIFEATTGFGDFRLVSGS